MIGLVVVFRQGFFYSLILCLTDDLEGCSLLLADTRANAPGYQFRCDKTLGQAAGLGIVGTCYSFSLFLNSSVKCSFLLGWENLSALYSFEFPRGMDRDDH